MIRIKICGITNLPDAKFAIKYGANMIGLIFYKKSPRSVDIEKAKMIVKALRGEALFVGVFVNEDISYVNEVASVVGLNFVQLHGNELPSFCEKVDFPVIKAFRVSANFNIDFVKKYKVQALLFDTYSKYCYGGTGKQFDWSIIKNFKTKIPVILSGGINAGNIKQAIIKLSPFCIDINSGVELIPGVKDRTKIKEIYNIIDEIDRSSLNDNSI